MTCSFKWSTGVSSDKAAGGTPAFGMGVGGEGTGLSDIAVAGVVEGVASFAEGPLVAVVSFAQGEIVGSDIRVGFGEALFGDGKLVHAGEAEVVFFGGWRRDEGCSF